MVHISRWREESGSLLGFEDLVNCARARAGARLRLGFQHASDRFRILFKNGKLILTNGDAVAVNFELSLADKDGAIDPGVLGASRCLENGCCLLVAVPESWCHCQPMSTWWKRGQRRYSPEGIHHQSRSTWLLRHHPKLLILEHNVSARRQSEQTLHSKAYWMYSLFPTAGVTSS